MSTAATRSPDQILSIEYPQDGKYRARKVISRSKVSSSTGKYPSWKMGRMVHWESPHELNAFRLLDANPAVTKFHEQPLLIRFALNGYEYRHYPDILVELGTSRELWEVKPADEAAESDVVARTQLLQRELPHIGFNYRVVIGEDLARQPRLSTVLTILKHGRQQVSMIEHEQVRLLFQATQEVNWALAKEVFGLKCYRLLCRSLLEGKISCDMENGFGPETKFWSI